MSWTGEKIQELTTLWDAGNSASAIGKQIGMSKNAVIGKAHRLGLRARPSPIKRGALKPMLAPQARLATPKSAEPKAAPAPTKPRERQHGASCLWPIGDPGDSSFHFCEEPAANGKPYCADHCEKAYIQRSRSESKAA